MVLKLTLAFDSSEQLIWSESIVLSRAPLRISDVTFYEVYHAAYVRAVIAQSVWRWATGWTIVVLGFDSRQGLGIFLFITVSRTAVGPTQPPIQWVPGAPSLRVKQPGREADHSPPSSAEVMNAWSYTFAPPIRLHGVVLS
jgi:hypothetical protein